MNDDMKMMIEYPPHYHTGKYECIDEMIALFGVEAVKDFCRCNAFKYRYRAGNKKGESAEKDMAKCEWYMTKLIELEGLLVIPHSKKDTTSTEEVDV